VHNEPDAGEDETGPGNSDIIETVVELIIARDGNDQPNRGNDEAKALSRDE
jgi:hypothetical protein